LRESRVGPAPAEADWAREVSRRRASFGDPGDISEALRVQAALYRDHQYAIDMDDSSGCDAAAPPQIPPLSRSVQTGGMGETTVKGSGALEAVPGKESFSLRWLMLLLASLVMLGKCRDTRPP
jgi:hypothetical protein